MHAVAAEWWVLAEVFCGAAAGFAEVVVAAFAEASGFVDFHAFAAEALGDAAAAPVGGHSFSFLRAWMCRCAALWAAAAVS